MSRSLLATLSLAAIAAFSYACSGPHQAEATTHEPRRLTVAVARAEPQDLSRDLVMAAEFRPYQEIDVHAKVAGYVKQIRVDVGDRVKAGELLAVLEIPEMKEELNQASAAFERSQSEVQRYQGELARSQATHHLDHLSYQRLEAVLKSRPNLVAQQEIDSAAARDSASEAQVASSQAALAAAREGVRVAKANQDRIQAMIDYSRITAPFAGIITKRFADTGAMVQAGTASNTQAMPVVRLSENDRLRLVLPVPENIVPRVHIGAPVDVRVSSLNRTFQGRVWRFSSRVDAATRTMETEIDVPNPGLVLVPGMYATAALTLDRRADALAVPVQAVSQNETSASVMVVENGVVQERGVTLGIETPNRVEILKGLKEKDLVVVGNRDRLQAGQPVVAKLVEGF